MTPLLHDLAALFYLGAAGMGWGGSRREALGRAVPWLLAVGVVLQAAGFVAFHRMSPPVPLESSASVLSLIAWVTVFAYLLSLRVARIQSVGLWVAAIGFVLTVSASLELRFSEASAASGADGGPWPHAHVLLSSAGFSLLALASLVGVTYLAKERWLKSKRAPGLRLPSLESLDRAGHLTLGLGFPLLTLGVITGMLWGLRQEGSVWTGHALFSVAAWLIYFVPVTLRVFRRQRGAGAARSVLFGFLFLAFSYVGVRLWGVAA